MTLEEILSSIQIKEVRETVKQNIRDMKIQGMTKNEIEATYAGAALDQKDYVLLMPLMFLWIEEVWSEEEEKNEV